VIVRCSVVVVVVVTGAGPPQPVNATVPAVSNMPIAARTRGEIAIMSDLQVVRVSVLLIRLGRTGSTVRNQIFG
jgi:hypothetical protein